MIDFHSHIIPEIDDGSRSIEETMLLLSEAKKAGFTKIISTSHYMNDRFEFDEANRKILLEAIKMGANNFGIDIELCLGSEIYATYDVVELLKEHQASTIDGTNYVLMELPMQSELPNLKNIIYNLMGSGYKPIIAHPERYEYVKEDPNWLIDYIELGVLFQSNYASILGWYGKTAQNTVKKLLKNSMIHFLGSDVHRAGTVYKEMSTILEELEKIIDSEILEELTTTNAELVLQNKPIYTEIPKKIKKGFWG